MRLIGRNHDLIGQILKGFKDEGIEKKQQEKKGYSVKRITDEQEYSRNIKGRGMVS